MMESAYVYVGFGLFGAAFFLWLLAAASLARIIYVGALTALGVLFEWAARDGWSVLSVAIGTLSIFVVAGALWRLSGADGDQDGTAAPH